MNTETSTTEYTIDAAGKRLGQVATQAASYLIGKNDPAQSRHMIADVKVAITNVSQLDLTERRKQDIYQTYSGYPSGLKKEKLAHLADRRGYREVVSRTVKGMLPKNKLQPLMMKNLTVTE